MIKYSKFNCSFPQEVDYFEPYPIMSNNDKNVTPYGQEINYYNTSVDYYSEETSVPIYNCSYYGYDEPIANLSIYLNDTQNGIDTWFNDNVTKIGAINISTLDQYITQINLTHHSGLFSWTDLWNTSLEDIYSFNPNITIESYCSECFH